MEKLIKNLPHGAGIDGKWYVEEVNGQIVAQNYFHVMDANGFYTGYVPFEAILTIDPNGQFSLSDVQIDEQATQEIENSYSENPDAAPYLGDLSDYLFETINYYLNN